VKRAVCTGGGTAGHVAPAVPVMRALLARGVVVDFVGSGLPIERTLLADLPVRYHAIAAGKLRRYLSLDNVRDAFRVLRGVWQAFRLLGRLAPDVVFSKGGFVSFPVVLAAWLRRVPVVAHESDLSPGLANRLALPFVNVLCVSFPVTRPGAFRGRVIFTGTPVRGELLAGDRSRGRRLLGVTDDRPVLLVTGGSLGADRINATVVEALDGLLERATVVHVCGPGKAAPVTRDGYHQFEFVTDDWGDLLAAADLVISRAGANTLYELLCLRKPNLLVPLSRAASRGDQIENAEYAAAAGYSTVVPEEELAPGRLLAAVDEILADLPGISGRIAGFQPPDSVGLIVEAIDAAARGDVRRA
jgi:UDP-N-acetylglucosamine--N-acetylmuramyl-(pentapeptide) pyrophosphoryl-undecaprenol N-acetylglucosamine transferase